MITVVSLVIARSVNLSTPESDMKCCTAVYLCLLLSRKLYQMKKTVFRILFIFPPQNSNFQVLYSCYTEISSTVLST